ncbi:hypothetical protein ColLi_13105 [Colletotrichum liriopes]|uniref:Uncharacterized protein n=1 Tax=Colletotrichum liriopes TaxID=708192 RepID=A0AA37LZ83_9PEZI|nr:hypothetical protein ColLi_13105 [Colletotrichum liriopes]
MPDNDEVSIIDHDTANVLYVRRNGGHQLSAAESHLLRMYETVQLRRRGQGPGTAFSAFSSPVLEEDDLHSVHDLVDDDRLTELMRRPEYEAAWKRFNGRKPPQQNEASRENGINLGRRDDAMPPINPTRPPIRQPASRALRPGHQHNNGPPGRETNTPPLPSPPHPPPPPGLQAGNGIGGSVYTSCEEMRAHLDELFERQRVAIRTIFDAEFEIKAIYFLEKSLQAEDRSRGV